MAAAAGSQGALPVDLYDETSLVIPTHVAEAVLAALGVAPRHTAVPILSTIFEFTRPKGLP